MSDMIYVKATKRGYLDGLRNEKDCFFCDPEQFSEKWMEKADKPKDVATPVKVSAEDLAARMAERTALTQKLEAQEKRNADLEKQLKEAKKPVPQAKDLAAKDDQIKELTKQLEDLTKPTEDGGTAPPEDAKTAPQVPNK